MVSSRSVILPLGATLIGCGGVNAQITVETPGRFSLLSEASAYSGPPLQVHFKTAPSALFDSAALQSMKALVYRLEGPVISFDLIHRVLPGHYQPPGCRTENNTKPEELTVACQSDCLNYGRYCEYHAAFPDHKNPALANVAGNHLVEESARRTCIFEQLGAKAFFEYIDVMHTTGCDTQYTDECITATYLMLHETLDVQDLNACMGAMSPNLDFENPLLESLMEDGVSVNPRLPIAFVDGASHNMVTSGGLNNNKDTLAVLQMICSSLPEGFEKPKICGFCTEVCPQKNRRTPDTIRCLWELRCNDRAKTHFNDYLAQIGGSNAVDDNSQQDIQTTSPEQQQTEEPTEIEDAGYSDTASVSAPSLEQQEEEKSGGGWFMVLTFLIAAFGFAAAALVILAFFRQHRSKKIVDQYLKEQAALHATPNERGAMPHWDHTYFPDEQVDLDVEPALQYRDHVNPSPPQQPPAKNSFLPKLT